ncbi:MAG: DUF1993 domain-containing protein [Candidatus Sericytochromatia bacterium]
MYHDLIQQSANMLLALPNLLDKAEAFATSRKCDVANLLQARLIPDQFSLTRQIQTACDNAKFMAARLSGQEAPKHPDTEQTVEELKQRVQHTVDYLRSFTPADFEGAAERQVVLPFIPHMYLTGHDYLLSFALPNFYFHVTTVYAILRANGVEIGKTDYFGVPLPLKPLAENP